MQLAARRLSVLDRAAYCVFVCGSLAVFAVARILPPSPSGLGTHTALGLPPCLWLRSFGIPCPACGMTTAFAHFARGEVLSAVATHPFGSVLAFALLLGLCSTPFALRRGVRPSALVWLPGADRVALCGLVLFLLSWIYKIAVRTW